MKTIQDLNKKTWYRLLKVLFALSTITTLVLASVVTWSDFAPNEVKDFYIYCKNIKSGYNAADRGIHIIDSEFYTERYYTTISVGTREIIKNECQISQNEVDEIGEKIKSKLAEMDSSGIKYSLQDYNNEVDNLIPYTIKPITYLDGAYSMTILYTLLVIIGTLFIAELVRRIFYYIILGNFWPKNKEK